MLAAYYASIAPKQGLIATPRAGMALATVQGQEETPMTTATHTARLRQSLATARKLRDRAEAMARLAETAGRYAQAAWWREARDHYATTVDRLMLKGVC